MKNNIMRLGTTLMLICSVAVFNKLSAQALVFDSLHFASNPHGNGSDIAAPIKTSGSFAATNVFKLYLSDASGDFSNEKQVGSYTSDYATFINGIIPSTTPAGSNYKLRVKSTSPVIVSDPSPSFAVVTATAAVRAKTIPLSSNRVLLTDLAFGWCKSPIIPQTGFILLNQSTTGSTVSAKLINNVNNTVDTGLMYNSGQVSLSLDRHYYTYIVTAVKAGVYSTRAYLLINSPNRIQLATDGEQQGCIPDTMQFQIGTDAATGGISENFPGIRYRVNWGDGVTDIYTFNQLMSINGLVKHSYLATSCSQPGITYNVTISAILPWTNAPQGCENPQVLSKAKIYKKPLAKFNHSASACVNTSVKFTNISDPGQSAFGTKCTTDADYFWFINGIAVQQNMNTKVANAHLNYTFTTPGKYEVKLIVDNGSCQVNEKIDSICINPQPVANFHIETKDTIARCIPFSFTPANLSNQPLCGSYEYEWEITDAATNAVVPTSAGVYTVTSTLNAFEPSFTFIKSGKYLLTLKVTSAACGSVVSSQRVIIATPPAGVTMPAPMSYCNPSTINFATASHLPQYNSNLGTESYKWTVTGAGYSFTGATSDTSAFPVIQFTNLGEYKVEVQFTNQCGTNTAGQTVVFNAPVVADITTAAIDTVCFNTVTYSATATHTGLVDSVRWESSGTGSFPNPSSSLISYVISAQDRTKGSVTLFYKAFPKQPTSCPIAVDSMLLVILPNNTAKDTTITLCNNSAFTYSPSTGTTGTIFSWTSSVISGSANGNTPTGTGTINDVLINNGSNTAHLRYVVQPATIQCSGAPFNVDVIVLPTPTLSLNSTTDTVCSGERTGINLSATSTTLFSWTSTITKGTATGNSAATKKAVSIIDDSLINTGNTVAEVIYAIQPYNQEGCAGLTVYDTVFVRTGTAFASAGSDQVLCGKNNTTLVANTPGNIETGLWKQIAGPSQAALSAVNQPVSTASSLTPGTYMFEWSIANGNCFVKRDTVMIIVAPAISNYIDTISLTACESSSVSLGGITATGGSTSVSYQWQASATGFDWQVITGANNVDYTFIANKSGWFRRLASIGHCTDTSAPVKLTLVPAITSNTINNNQQLCSGSSAQLFTGSVPNGGNGLYQYQWQYSTDSVYWHNATGATTQHYNPGTLTQSTWFRRLVTSAQCDSAYASISNAIKVTLLPNASASFTSTVNASCAPFLISNTVIQAQPNPANATYNWYANGYPIGSGLSFPGYTINSGNDSVNITLVVTGSYGCNSDTMQHIFYSLASPQLSFNTTIDSACGPVAVNLVNTTPNLSAFSYYWNFGNGQTSTAAQPGTITFLPATTHTDTVYTVRLYSFGCDTSLFERKLLVKSKPRALFSPSKTTGCSPFTVTFANQSHGTATSFKWIFGDGSTHVTNSKTPVQHTYFSSTRDTFIVRLVASNDCGSDTATYNLVVSPNTIQLHFSVNGTDATGCAPHMVKFINNSSGAAVFNWNMGDGNTFTTYNNIDTITHYYATPGNYAVSLKATNACSDTTDVEHITVLKTPVAVFIPGNNIVCIGDTIAFLNNSDSATSYKWFFGNGKTSLLKNPNHTYSSPGSYIVSLVAGVSHPSGLTCRDTSYSTINVVAQQTGFFTVSDSIGSCLPFTVTFINKNTPSVKTTWDFGNGKTAIGDSVTHTYTAAGTFTVKMTAKHPAGCSYIYSRNIQTSAAPAITWSYDTSPVCDQKPVKFQLNNLNGDSVRIFFGDGTSTVTNNAVVYHSYTNAGKFVPRLNSLAGSCPVNLVGKDTIKVDIVKAAFKIIQQNLCGSTQLSMLDSSTSAFGINKWSWSLGNNQTSTNPAPVFGVATAGIYKAGLVVTSLSGCKDTITMNVPVAVNSVPSVSIIADTVACSNQGISYKPVISSKDSVTSYSWSFSTGATSILRNPVINYNNAGRYVTVFVAATANGCSDTATHTIKINPSTNVVSTQDQLICKGETISLTTTGASTYSWASHPSLSCKNCPSPVASPSETTTYIVTGNNSYGCKSTDTVTITVAQPFKVNVFGNDSICIGQSTVLAASGASTYKWNIPTQAAPINAATVTVTPGTTTRYQIVGSDTHGCFTDTAFVTVAVGQPPVIKLGPDRQLASGDNLQLNAQVFNGPISNWTWYPANDLSCNDCPNPVLQVKNDACITVSATSVYGCEAKDTLCIKTFCAEAQVFIANAFTPDGDGVNDYLYVRGKGLKLIKSFRVFNRWGQVVFERANFIPDNNQANGWSGKVNGKDAPPDVYIYTCEVVCDNETPYTFKGNVTLLK